MELFAKKVSQKGFTIETIKMLHTVQGGRRWYVSMSGTKEVSEFVTAIPED